MPTGQFVCVIGVALLLCADRPAPVRACGQEPVSAEQRAALDTLLGRLGDEEFTVREEATREIIALGPAAIPHLRARLSTEADPEVCRRLRYILKNIVPPDLAVLVVRADAGSGLEPGDLITHANNRRVRDRSELMSRLAVAPTGLILHVNAPSGPREVGPVAIARLQTLANYRAPRGEAISRALRLYAAGYAEQAYDLLGGLGTSVPPDECSPPLQAIIAYTAGGGATARQLLGTSETLVEPASGGNDWTGPSNLDLFGPHKAPFYLEQLLWNAQAPNAYQRPNDPDIRVQRVLVPAGRYVDALSTAAGYWWTRYRIALDQDQAGGRAAAGNMLAVASWMLSELDLLSECLRLIGPRSEILKESSHGFRKWLRVQTDAWLPFLADDPRGAVDLLYEHALEVLQRPPTDSSVIIRNPRVAAQIAFFLYQVPEDPRVEELLDVISRPGHTSANDYIYWMCLALTEGNQEVIRKHVTRLLPLVGDDAAVLCAQTVALLELMQEAPNDDVVRAARERLAQAASGEERVCGLAAIDALHALAAERAHAAREQLAGLSDCPALAALRHTVEFVSAPPPTAAAHPALRRPLLVVPIDRERDTWFVLARDRRLLRFEARTGRLTPLDRPTPDWFPGPLNWPWVGRQESTGRVWVYDRRRVLEVADGHTPSLRLNVQTQDIPAFDRYVGPVFDVVADAVAARPTSAGEDGEFLRADVRAHGQYFTDPALPEVGFIQPLSQDARMVHVAFRGGPHILVHADARQAWASPWIAARLGLDAPPTFFVQAVGEQPTPVLFLMSSHGLIRFDVAGETLTRVALPGDEPYPALVPESCPYERRDPRWVYCARLPEDGGQVYRVTVADNTVEPVDMINVALPKDYYRSLERGDIRARVDRRFAAAGLPRLEEFVHDAVESVARWQEQR